MIILIFVETEGRSTVYYWCTCEMLHDCIPNIFLARKSIKLHMYMYFRFFLCDYCQLGFVKEVEREEHLRSKHGEYYGRFLCVPCDVEFPERPALAIHRRKEHPGQKYQCAACGMLN